MRWLFLCFLLFPGAACVHAPKKSVDETRCPEFQNLKCLTPVLCDMDWKRGCRVCRCEEAWTPDNFAPGPPGPDDTKGRK